MKALVLKGPNNFNVTGYAMPTISEDELLMKIKACAICGTDIRILEGKKIKDVRYPSIIGHEISGYIFKKGEDIEEFNDGDRICIAPVISCNKCYACLNKSENICLNRIAIGYQFNGGFAEYLRIPSIAIKSGNVFRIPDNMSYDEATLTEPLACCINGIKKAQINIGCRILIIGAGPIGLMHVQLARAAGAKTIIVSEPNEYRRNLALQLGAKYAVDLTDNDLYKFVNLKTNGTGVDCVIMAVGIISLINPILKMVRKGGVVNLFAGFNNDAISSIDPNIIHYNEITLNGSSAFSRRDYVDSLNIISEKLVNVKRLISHKFKLKDFIDAYKTFKSGQCIKIIINP